MSLELSRFIERGLSAPVEISVAGVTLGLAIQNFSNLQGYQWDYLSLFTLGVFLSFFVCVFFCLFVCLFPHFLSDSYVISTQGPP